MNRTLVDNIKSQRDAVGSTLMCSHRVKRTYDTRMAVSATVRRSGVIGFLLFPRSSLAVVIMSHMGWKQQLDVHSLEMPLSGLYGCM
jgi:hypothetical protein